MTAPPKKYPHPDNAPHSLWQSEAERSFIQSRKRRVEAAIHRQVRWFVAYAVVVFLALCAVAHFVGNMP